MLRISGRMGEDGWWMGGVSSVGFPYKFGFLSLLIVLLFACFIFSPFPFFRSLFFPVFLPFFCNICQCQVYGWVSVGFVESEVERSQLLYLL